METKEYTNGEITILWQPGKCSHAGVCVKTLPEVYFPKEKPWIKMENATTEALLAQVAQCPSGALSIKGEQDEISFELEDNGKKGRHIIYYRGEYAGEMTYTWAGESMFIIDHTEVDTKFGGKGLGKKLVMQAIEQARKSGVKIMPLCPFAKKFFDKTAGLEDVKM